jgi:hypothetical protein
MLVSSNALLFYEVACIQPRYGNNFEDIVKNMQSFILHDQLIFKGEIPTNLVPYRRPSVLEQENMIKQINPSNHIASERRLT